MRGRRDFDAFIHSMVITFIGRIVMNFDCFRLSGEIIRKQNMIRLFINKHEMSLHRLMVSKNLPNCNNNQFCFFSTFSENMSQVITARLSRNDAQPWGFRLQGGKDFGTPLVIQKVSKNISVCFNDDCAAFTSFALTIINNQLQKVLTKHAGTESNHAQSFNNCQIVEWLNWAWWVEKLF